MFIIGFLSSLIWLLYHPFYYEMLISLHTLFHNAAICYVFACLPLLMHFLVAERIENTLINSVLHVIQPFPICLFASTFVLLVFACPICTSVFPWSSTLRPIWCVGATGQSHGDVQEQVAAHPQVARANVFSHTETGLFCKFFMIKFPFFEVKKAENLLLINLVECSFKYFFQYS